MNYSGVARNPKEIEDALSLAALNFSPAHGGRDEAIERKAFILGEHPGFDDGSPVVVCNKEGDVVGSAFLIDCTFPCGDKSMRGVFVSSVSVAKAVRGQGFSVALMTAAIDVATARGADIAVVIARRAVDGYYTRFGFWGVSQYSKIDFNISTLPQDAANVNAISQRRVSVEDFEQCAFMYDATYKNMLGHCVRSPKMWAYIYKKVFYLNLEFDAIWQDDMIVAYVIHDGEDNIHEIATKQENLTWCIRSFIKSIRLTGDNVRIHIPPTHSFLKRLEGADVSMSLRECPFGGHMVRILNQKSVACARTSSQTPFRVKADGAILNFADTVDLLRLARVTDFDSTQRDGLSASFNIPFLDQI